VFLPLFASFLSGDAPPAQRLIGHSGVNARFRRGSAKADQCDFVRVAGPSITFDVSTEIVPHVIEIKARTGDLGRVNACVSGARVPRAGAFRHRVGTDLCRYRRPSRFVRYGGSGTS